MNIAPLRISILKESMIFVVLVTCFFGIAFYLDTMREEYTKKKTAAVSSANQLLSEKRNMENRFAQVKEGMDDYEESKRRAKEPGLFIDSQAVRDLFNNYQPRFFLKKISVEMRPITEFRDDPKYVRKNFVVTRSNAKVSIETVSDEDIYDLIRAMQKELPGFTKITAFSLVKRMDLSNEALTEIRKSGTQSVIGSEMTFDWYGLQSTNPASPFNKYVSKKREGPAP